MKVELQPVEAEAVEAEKEQRAVLLPWLTALFLGSAALGLFFLISPALTGERYYKVGFHANPQMYARQQGEPPVEHEPALSVDVQRRVPDVSKIESRLGWKARFPLEEGLRRTVDWYLAQQRTPAPAAP